MSTQTAEIAKPAPTKLAIDPKRYERPCTSLQDLGDLGKPLIPQFQAALPKFLSEHADRFLRMLITECGKNPALMKCTPRSLFGCVIQAAQLGLEIGGSIGQCYLVPFGTEATFIVGYKGFVALAYRSGMVRDIAPEVVREKDTFEIRFGTDRGIRHIPDPGFDSPPIGYYVTVELVNGGKPFKYMTFKQIELHRDNFSRAAKSGPWVKNFDEMAKKTCLRALAKWIPLSSEMTWAAALDEEAEQAVPQQLGMALQLEGLETETSKSSQLRDRFDKRNGEPPAVAADQDLFPNPTEQPAH